jgi:nitronate monooxygenase
MRNSFTRQWGRDANGFARNLTAEQERFQLARMEDDADIAPVIVGEAVDLVVSRDSAQAILTRMIEQAELHITRLGSFIGKSK